MMARTDIHRNAIHRHLGAACYDSLHGQAARPLSDAQPVNRRGAETAKGQRAAPPHGPRAAS